jgi:23S rRNA (adenine2503-C2)-methyltransferase
MLRFEDGMSGREADDHESFPVAVSAPASMETGVPVGVDLAPVRVVLSSSASEWNSWMAKRGYPVYRTRQLLDWVIRRRAESFERMSDIPKIIRQQLAADWTVFGTQVAYHDVAPDGTDKLVLKCRDGRQIECVLMAEGSRRTVCLSTQVGCGMGCVFCASGLKGVERNLSADEILEQALRLRNLLPLEETVTHIVVMGMGESLANLDNLIAALDRLCSVKEGLGISQRRVTISTVGLPEKIRKLAELNRQYHLAVSLHAPTEALRNSLVPVNEKIGLAEVVAAADAYFAQTGRQVTYEYVLLRGVNDRQVHAEALGRLLHARGAHVNLIPYNPVAGLPFERPDTEAINRFTAILRHSNVSVTVRKTKGREIDAACGQLRRRLSQDQKANGAPAAAHGFDAGKALAGTAMGRGPRSVVSS